MEIVVKALKARNEYKIAATAGFYVAPSALQDCRAGYLGRCPKAVAFRTFGAVFRLCVHVLFKLSGPHGQKRRALQTCPGDESRL